MFKYNCELILFFYAFYRMLNHHHQQQQPRRRHRKHICHTHEIQSNNQHSACTQRHTAQHINKICTQKKHFEFGTNVTNILIINDKLLRNISI